MSRAYFSRLPGLICLVFLSLPLSAIHAEPPKNGIAWETDLLKARAQAVKTGRPLLVVFGAEWCTFCKKMENTTMAEKEMVKSINTRFVPVHLDFDKQRPVADALKIKAIPCSVVLSSDADVLSRHDGFAKSEDYLKTLATGLKAHQINLTSGQTNTRR